MLRFIVYAVPLLVLLLALFGFTVEWLDFEPRAGAVIKLALFEQPRVPGQLILGTWLVEASGLIALFLLSQGRFGTWWLDGLVAGWIGWIFRGPLLVITIVVAARQPQDPWWTLAFGWWVLYSVCGLSLAILARRSNLEPWGTAETPTSTAALEAQSLETQPLEAVAESVKSGETDELVESEEKVESKALVEPGESVETEAVAEPDESVKMVESKAIAEPDESVESEAVAEPERSAEPDELDAREPAESSVEPTTSG